MKLLTNQIQKTVRKSASFAHHKPTKFLRSVSLVFIFIVVFLLVFTLLGCTATGSTYADVYAVKFTVDSSENGTIAVVAGYYGICGISSNTTTTTTCAALGNLTALADFQYINTSTSTAVDLVSLAKIVSDELIHPTVFIVSLVFVLSAMATSLVDLVCINPNTTASSILKSISLWSCIISTLLCGIGSAWAHVAANTLAKVLYESTGGLVTASIGRRMDAMGWTSFSFLWICTAIIVLCAAIDAYQQARQANITEVLYEQEGPDTVKYGLPPATVVRDVLTVDGTMYGRQTHC
ncbi:Ca2+ regulator and membrane fusion protein Fig1-domain-containing protein [Lipomyces oligophaga]|uniref:Ca2+ regulator and membrane fusion protein Fig1-domain-containing protein n=1 Tax=Lipomyces oligophaga TaxID=45792 RepID=UPI0034CE1628